MAGYSPKSLAQKLGIKEGHKALLIQPPDDFEENLGPLPGVFLFRAATPAEADAKALAAKAPFDFIHVFCRGEEELSAAWPRILALLAINGMLWVSWPKGKSAKASDKLKPFNETRVREMGLAGGLVDVKVCAVDETWSGLKFMFRLKDRPKP